MKDRDDLLEYHSAHQDDDEKYYRPFAVDIDDGWCYVQEVAGNLQEDYQRSKFKDDVQKLTLYVFLREFGYGLVRVWGGGCWIP